MMSLNSMIEKQIFKNVDTVFFYVTIGLRLSIATVL